MKKIHFVYITTNLINGKQYVGDHSTDNIDDNYKGSGKYLKNSFLEHGRKNFKRDILDFFPTKKEAFEAQSPLIIKHNTLYPNGYNISPSGGMLEGGSHSEESKDKIGRGNTGKIKDQKTKDKIGYANSIRVWEDKSKDKLRQSKLGTHASEEAKKNLSTSHIGKVPWNKGKTGFSHSVQTKDQIRKTMKERGICPQNYKTTKQ